MEIGKLSAFQLTKPTSTAKPSSPHALPPSVTEPTPKPTETFSSSQAISDLTAPSAPLPKPASKVLTSEVALESLSGTATQVNVSIDGVVFQGGYHGPLSAIIDPPLNEPQSSSIKEQSFIEQLQAIALATPKPGTPGMEKRESVYLERFPFKQDNGSLQARAALKTRYADPSTSSGSVTRTINQHALDRGINIQAVPKDFDTPLTPSGLKDVKAFAQGIVDRFFLSDAASKNPEKHATVSEQTQRFLDLTMQAAPPGFTAADAAKLVASNLALISYQDQAAAENMLGDHGVRHLLGHNVKACESLADALEQQGTPVSATERLMLHQTMIVHDLGYAMDTVRDAINRDGIKGQDAGHNVLAAKYLKERAQDPSDPLTKLFSPTDLDTVHRCVLFHDKDAEGKPGIHLQVGSQLGPEERATNLETITRLADNSHAFEDKLPELLYRKPGSLKILRLMKTAGELGDKALVKTLKDELASDIASDPDLAVDDRTALLRSVASLGDKSYRFSVGRIAGTQPSFEVSPRGKVTLQVAESDAHQDTMALFGMESYQQINKFIKDCTGEKVHLSGQSELIEGKDVSIRVLDGAQGPTGPNAFNAELRTELLTDRSFSNYALKDARLSNHQAMLEERVQLGEPNLQNKLDALKTRRQALLNAYRANV